MVHGSKRYTAKKADASPKPKPIKRADSKADTEVVKGGRKDTIYSAFGIDKSQKNGIIKNIKIPAETSEIRSMSGETKELIQQAIDKLNNEYEIHLDEFITAPLDDEYGAVPFQFQPIRGKNGELIKRLVINSRYDFMDTQEAFQERIMRNFNRKVLASNSVEGLISHELAHVMTFQDISTYSGYLLENKRLSKRMVFGISDYASLSNDGAECIAEAFAAKRCGQSLSDEAQALLNEFIERWRKA